MFLLDTEGRITWASPEAERLVGYARQELTDRPLDELVSRVPLVKPEAAPPPHPGFADIALLHRQDGAFIPVLCRRSTLLTLDEPTGELVILREHGDGAPAESPRGDGARADEVRSWLLMRERASRIAAERAMDRLARLQAVTAALSETLTVEQVSRVIIGHACDALQATTSALYVLDENDRDFRFAAARDVPDAALATWSVLPLDAPYPLAAAIRTGEPIWFDDREKMEEAFPRLKQTQYVPQEKNQSLAALPLRVGTRVIGGAVFTFAESLRMAEDEREFILALVAHCAQALERARLFEAERAARTRAEESAALLDALFAAAPLGLNVMDRDLRMIRVNGALSSISGWPVEAHVGRTMAELRPDIGPQIERTVRAVFETGKPALDQELVTRAPAGDGQTHYWLANRFPVRGASGEVVAVASAVLDITARKRAELQLRESEERFRLIVEHAPVGMALVGLDGRLLRVNRAFSEMLGYSPEELVKRTFQELTFPEDLDKDLALARKLEAGEIPRYQLEKRYVRKDGTVAEALLHGSVLREPDGRPAYFIAQVKDITARKQAERERERLLATLDRERQWLASVLARMPDGVILYEQAPEGPWKLTSNQRAEELMGRPLSPDAGPQQLLGLLCEPNGRPLPADDLPLARTLRGDTLSGVELAIRRPNGAQLPIRASAVALRDAQGGIVGAVQVFEDISVIKSFERMREEWTSVIAHDLRQQVGVIAFSAQFAERLQAKGDGARVARELERIRGAARQLDRMVEDLLDLSRLEARRLKFVPDEVDLPALAQETLQRLAYLANDRPMRLVVRDVISPAWADAGRIEQVLGNLISNAVKYGEAGTEIRVELEGRFTELEVTVINHGRGIPPHEMERLFDRFARSVETRRSNIPGLGLGLYICKGLVEAQGGRIWAESVPGDVTRFHFTVPLASTTRAVH